MDLSQSIYNLLINVLQPFILEIDSWDTWQLYLFVASVFGIVVFFIKGGFSK